MWRSMDSGRRGVTAFWTSASQIRMPNHIRTLHRRRFWRGRQRSRRISIWLLVWKGVALSCLLFTQWMGWRVKRLWLSIRVDCPQRALFAGGAILTHNPSPLSPPSNPPYFSRVNLCLPTRPNCARSRGRQTESANSPTVFCKPKGTEELILLLRCHRLNVSEISSQNCGPSGP